MPLVMSQPRSRTPGTSVPLGYPHPLPVNPGPKGDYRMGLPELGHGVVYLKAPDFHCPYFVSPRPGLQGAADTGGPDPLPHLTSSRIPGV